MSRQILWHLLFTLGAFLLTTLAYLGYASPRFRALFRRSGAEDAAGFDPVVYTRWLLAPTFLSLWWFFFPLAQGDALRNNTVSSVFDAVIRSGQTFSLDSSIQDVWDAADDAGRVFAFWDRVWISFILTLAPVLTLVSAATLFRIPRFWFTMLFSRRRICVLSDLNERAVIYAEVLQKAAGSGREGGRVHPPHVVFCANDQPEDTDTSGLPGPALVLRQDICRLYLTPWAAKRTSFYLLTQNENTVVEQAERLRRKYAGSAGRIFCVSAGSLNELAIDRLNRGSAPERLPPGEAETLLEFQRGRLLEGSRKQAEAVRMAYIEIISEPSRVVFHSLYDRRDPLLDPALLRDVLRLQTGQERTLNVLILGAGSVGKVLARTLLWYCQLPGMGVRITVADREKAERIRGAVLSRNPDFPELLEKIGCAGRAELCPIGEKDLLSDDLEALLRASHRDRASEYHLVFVTLGDDIRNLQLTLRIRRHYLRHPNRFGCPRLSTVIWDESVNAMVGSPDYEPLQGAEGQDYSTGGAYNPRCRVRLMGSMSETIATEQQLAFDALRYHAYYCRETRRGPDTDYVEKLCMPRTGIRVKDFRSYYENSESDERSNWAAAVHGILKAEWYDMMTGLTGEERIAALAETEQIRWCIFKLTEGDCPVPEDYLPDYMARTPRGRDTDAIRGYHAALRSWQDLQEKQKQNFACRGDKWQEYIDQTTGIVRLAVSLEKARRAWEKGS